jgi:sarcosine oxidase / L-pipecolate oxidase
MTPAELKKYANMPIVDHLEGGLVFPPQKDGLFKIGACHFVTNFAGRNVSLPRYRSDNPTDGIPKPIETILRNWMREFVPELADREWCETRICWDADMPDYHFLIDKHPEHPGLQLAVGGSAHGFKFLPVVGKYIVDAIEGRLDEETRGKWRWRPGAGIAGPTPHPAPLIELSEIAGWEKERAKL